MTGLEEERRLAYVGLTRARKTAYLSFAANRRVHNQWQNALPSRFLGELPAEHIERARRPAPSTARKAACSRPASPDGRWTGASYMQRTARRPPRPSTPPRWWRPKSRPLCSAAPRCFTRSSATAPCVSADGDKLEIEFDKAGRKKVMAGFVVPAHEAG